MRQLAIDNPRDTGSNPERMVGLLSKNVAAALYATNHSSLQEVIDRVEEKRRRRNSSSVFKTAATVNLTEQKAISNALPTIMSKTTDPRSMNDRGSPIGTVVNGSIGQLGVAKASI